MDNNWLNQSSMIKEKSINYLTHIFQDRILCTKVNMSVHPDEIIFCEKSYKTNFLSSTEDKVR